MKRHLDLKTDGGCVVSVKSQNPWLYSALDLLVYTDAIIVPSLRFSEA